MPSSQDQTSAKDGKLIKVGDTVETRFRGGKREGEVHKVEAVVETQKDIENAGDLGVNVQNPPKVVFTDQLSNLHHVHQHGHRVSHNPGTLSHSSD